MHPQSQESDPAHQFFASELDSPSQKMPATLTIESQARYEGDVDSPYSQDIASSPSFVGSEDSVPVLGPFGSPSPSSQRVSLVSNASVGDSVPGTPTTRLFEESQVNDASDTSPRYHRIHSTPYPKPRLPLQLTPHPQARLVSLPEWSQNRDPFLEAMRNLRSVSSPARLKRAPLSPVYAGLKEEGSFDVSGDSSGSSVSAPSFPALDISDGQRTNLSCQSQQLTSYSIPRELFYRAPEGFFFTPPSLRSLVLSPPTTGPERSLPQDRPLAAIREDVSTTERETNSEDEVSYMLQQTSFVTANRHNRSSVAFSTTSRSSSPESVVFLSSAARIPHTFLGSMFRTSSSTASPSPPLNSAMNESPEYDAVSGSKGEPSVEGHAVSTKTQISEQVYNYIQGQKQTDNESEDVGPTAPMNAASGAHQDSDWIFFDPPKPIPALHGPASLPYARCPSGAEGVVLDDQQALDRIVWGLSERDANPSSTTIRPSQTKSFGPYVSSIECQAATNACTSDSNIYGTKRGSTEAAAFVSPEDYSTTGSATRPAVLVGQNLASPLNPKGKHVRFVDTTSDGSPVENVPQDQRTSATDSRQDISNFSRLSKSGSTNLAQILFDQVEKARAGELKTRSTIFGSRQETLDQLRRFGVPFRPHGLPTPPNTVSPKFSPQFHPFPSTMNALVPSVNMVVQQSSQEPRTGVYEQDTLSNSLPTTTLGRLVSSQPGPLEFPTRALERGLASGSLSNVKSVPLLKLRQRQHAEMVSWRSREMISRDTQVGTEHETQEISGKCSPAVEHPLKPIPRAPTRSTPINTTPPVSAKTATTISNNSPLPNRRRPRKGGKRTQQDVPTGIFQSGSTTKENSQSLNNLNDVDGRKQPLRQGGRRKGPQRD